MGGDRAPAEALAGARLAREWGIPVVLVGDPTQLGDVDGFEVIPASEVIEMDEEPGLGVRTKKDSSLVRAAEAVRDGRASATVSAGNTGATMASALLRMGRISGVSRPAIATAIPVPGHSPTILLDSGGNADCQASWLLQFAQMGSVYSSARFGVERPRVALLSIGEEDSKGNQLVKEAHGLLREAEGLHFVGNVEGRDILGSAADVVVTDGFTGNVTLKTLEGSLRFVSDLVSDAARSSALTKLGGLLLKKQLKQSLRQFDPNVTGGAMLLGVDGVSIISHGSSSALGIASALQLAKDMVDADVVAGMKASLGRPLSDPGLAG